MAPHDEEAYTHVPMNDHEHDDPYGAGPSNASDPYNAQASTAYDAAAVGGGASTYDDDTTYGGAGGRQTSHGSSGYAGAPGVEENPFRQDDPFADDHAYGGAGAAGAAGRPYAPPTAEEYDDDRPVQFPAANYDRVVR